MKSEKWTVGSKPPPATATAAPAAWNAAALPRPDARPQQTAGDETRAAGEGRVDGGPQASPPRAVPPRDAQASAAAAAVAAAAAASTSDSDIAAQKNFEVTNIRPGSADLRYFNKFVTAAGGPASMLRPGCTAALGATASAAGPASPFDVAAALRARAERACPCDPRIFPPVPGPGTPGEGVVSVSVFFCLFVFESRPRARAAASNKKNANTAAT